MRRIVRQLCMAGAMVAVGGSPLPGQSLLERSPNMSGGWTGTSGLMYFHLVHRFNQSGAPEHKVTNSPTMLVAAGLPRRLLVGVNYATNSLVAPRYPNEWELFARHAPLVQSETVPVDVSVQAGYNVAAHSVDGEVQLARDLGAVRVMGAFRALSNAYHADETRYAWGAGAAVSITDHIALAGDVASLLDRSEGEKLAWSAGVHVGLPFTPHTLSLHASNTHTATLQGSSVGIDQIHWGFEFTVPLTLSRYFGGREPEPTVAVASPEVGMSGGAVAATGDTVRVSIKNLAYDSASVEIAPGTTVTWTNGDPLAHTVTATEGAFDSGEIAPGESWSYTFTKAGTFDYACTPHPFMTGRVVVRSP